VIFKPLVGRKEWVDQIAHALVGAAIVVGFAFIIPILAAALLSIAVGVGREVRQRLKAGMRWWDCGEGCRLDLAGWAVGVLIGVLISWGLYDH